jgi:hypothetical protein
MLHSEIYPSESISHSLAICVVGTPVYRQTSSAIAPGEALVSDLRAVLGEWIGWRPVGQTCGMTT